MDKIEYIAKVVRKELIDFVQSKIYFRPNWSGSCLICSWVLDRVYREFGIDSNLCIGRYDNSDHAFVIVDNNVIDITATQFLRDEVVIEPYQNSDYSILFSGKSVKLDIRNWPTEQTPRAYKPILKKIFIRIVRKIIEEDR